MSPSRHAFPRRDQITVDEYHTMADIGLLAPDSRVELIEGEIIDMAPIGDQHRAVVAFLTKAFSRAIGDRAILLVQSSIRLDGHSEPEPDLSLLAPRDDFYRNRPPGPGDTLLVVEVSDSTAQYDRTVKVPLYAKHRIPEVWIVDLSQSVLASFRAPADGKYGDVRSETSPGIIPLPGLPGTAADLSRVLSL